MSKKPKSVAEAMSTAIDILSEMVEAVKTDSEAAKELPPRELEGGYYFQVGVRDMVFLHKHGEQRAFGNTFGECTPSCLASTIYNYIFRLEEDGYWNAQES